MMLVNNEEERARRMMLIAWSSSGEARYIVCANSAAQAQVMELADEAGLRIPKPILAEDLAKDRNCGGQIGQVSFDNVDEVLKALLGPTPIRYHACGAPSSDFSWPDSHSSAA